MKFHQFYFQHLHRSHQQHKKKDKKLKVRVPYLDAATAKRQEIEAQYEDTEAALDAARNEHEEAERTLYKARSEAAESESIVEEMDVLNSSLAVFEVDLTWTRFLIYF